MKKTYFLLFISVLFFSACSKSKKIDPQLQTAVEAMNKQLPMKVDPVTSLMKVEALPGDVMKYSYQVTTKTDIKDTLTAKKTFSRKILYNLKNNPSLSVLTEKNVTFVHSYSDNKGKYLFSVTTTPDDYKKDLPNLALSELLPQMAWFNSLLLPMKLDNVTELKNCQFAAPDTLVMTYSLDNSNLDFNDNAVSMLKQTLVRSTKADISSKEAKDKNAIFKHVYVKSKGGNITIVVTPSDYK